MDGVTANESIAMRVAAVLLPDLSVGEAANVTAIVTAGLKCDAFSFPIADKSGNHHAAVLWNVVVLKAKSSNRMAQLIEDAKAAKVSLVAFSRTGQTLSNDFQGYSEALSKQETSQLEVLGVGLFGPDEVVRALTKRCSLFQ